MSDLAKLAKIFRAEVARMEGTSSTYSGWQAVRQSLLALADEIEKAAEENR